MNDKIVEFTFPISGESVWVNKEKVVYVTRCTEYDALSGQKVDVSKIYFDSDCWVKVNGNPKEVIEKLFGT